MKTLKHFLLFALLVLIVGAPSAFAQTQTMHGTTVQGCTVGTQNCQAIDVSSAGVVTIQGVSGGTAVKVAVVPSSTYPTAYLSGSMTISSGSTTTVTSTPTEITALTVTNVSNASVTVNVMDNSSNYIFPPNFVIPAGQSIGFPVGSGLFYSGVTASASVASAAKINVGGYQ